MTSTLIDEEEDGGDDDGSGMVLLLVLPLWASANLISDLVISRDASSNSFRVSLGEMI